MGGMHSKIPTSPDLCHVGMVQSTMIRMEKRLKIVTQAIPLLLHT